MTKIQLIAGIASLAAALSAACQRTDVSASAAPTGSFVKIANISPDTSVPLRAGDQVKVQVEVDYSLTSNAGTVNLVIQAADHSSLAHNMEVLQKGTGKVTLVAEFVVPHSSAVQIFTPLSAQGQTSTSTVDTRAYKVISK